MKICSNINTQFNNIFKAENRNVSVSFSSNGLDKKLTASLDVLSSLNKPLVNNKITIPPKPFFYDYFGSDKKNILNSSNKVNETFVYETNDSVRIKPEYNPDTLKILDESVVTDNLSNLLFPCGTLAISSDLKGNLSTEGLWQCAAVSFVDKKHDLQTLMHFCPTVSTDANEKVLEYILSASNPKDLEVTIVPGCYIDTDLTVEYLFNKINDFSKGAKIKFANFPDNNHDTVILKDGKLYAADYKNVIKNTNPIDKLIFASSF
jgi:hypothetical protein